MCTKWTWCCLALFGCLVSGCSKDPVAEPPQTVEGKPNSKNSQPGPAPGNASAENAKPAAIELFKGATPPPTSKPIDVKEGTPLKKWTSTSTNSAVTSDGKTLFVGDNDGTDEKKDPHLLGIEIATKKQVHDWPLKGKPFAEMLLSSNNKVLVFTREKAPGLITVFDVASGKVGSKYQHKIDKESEFLSNVDYMAISPDGKMVVSVNGVEHNYVAWSTENGKKLWQTYSMYYSTPCFSADGKEILVWLDKGPAIVDAANGKVQRKYPTTDFGSVSHQLAFSSDGQAIFIHATDDINETERWQSFLIKINRQTGKREWSLRTGTKMQEKITVLPDGETVVLWANSVADSFTTQLQVRAASNGALQGWWLIDASCVGNDGWLLPDGKTYVADEKVFTLPAVK